MFESCRVYHFFSASSHEIALQNKTGSDRQDEAFLVFTFGLHRHVKISTLIIVWVYIPGSETAQPRHFVTPLRHFVNLHSRKTSFVRSRVGLLRGSVNLHKSKADFVCRFANVQNRKASFVCRFVNLQSRKAGFVYRSVT